MYQNGFSAQIQVEFYFASMVDDEVEDLLVRDFQILPFKMLSVIRRFAIFSNPVLKVSS